MGETQTLSDLNKELDNLKNLDNYYDFMLDKSYIELAKTMINKHYDELEKIGRYKDPFSDSEMLEKNK